MRTATTEHQAADSRDPLSAIRLRIAFYCPNKPLSHAHPSGDLTIARELQQAINRRGHECREIVAFRSRWFWETTAGWGQAFRKLIEAYLHIRRFSPDLWLTYHTYYKSPDVFGPLFSRLWKIPYVIFQPMYSTRRRKTSGTRPGFYLNRLAVKAATAVFTNNVLDLEALGRLLPFQRISYLPPGINLGGFEHDEEGRDAIRSHYSIPDETPLIMTAARFRAGVKYDSMVYLFRSLAKINPEGYPYLLLVVGDGPMGRQLEALAAELLPGRVVFTGRIERQIMAQYYSAADLFAFPGIGESLGMVYLEAQACGLPVVALDSPGVAQVVQHGLGGLLVARDEGDSLARAIGELLADPEKRRALGGNGRCYVTEHRNAMRHYRQLCDQLEAIVSQRRNRFPSPVTH